jgi:hypothetical protein
LIRRAEGALVNGAPGIVTFRNGRPRKQERAGGSLEMAR